MHSNLHYALYEAMAADRARTPRRAALHKRRLHPPPIRGRAAYATARMARRIDRESARRAIA
jgi:hypothetical protein